MGVVSFASLIELSPVGCSSLDLGAFCLICHKRAHNCHIWERIYRLAWAPAFSSVVAISLDRLAACLGAAVFEAEQVGYWWSRSMDLLLEYIGEHSPGSYR